MLTRPHVFLCADFDKDIAVEYVSDVILYGQKKATTVIQAADFAFKQHFSFPFSVVYGLSPVFKGDNDTIASPFYQNWRDGHFKSPYAAYHWCYGNHSRKTCKGADALQTLGYYDPSLIDGDIEWYDNIDSTTTNVNSVDFVYDPAIYNYWMLELSRLAMGSKVYALNDTLTPAAVFDHASYGRGAPISRTLYADLIQRTNATQVTLAEPPNNGPQKTYAFNCANAARLPPLHYTFKGSTRTWSSPAKHWVVETTDSANVDAEKSCIFDVRVVTDLPNGGGDSFDIGNFGETFLKDKYIVFDFDRLRIGLAKLRI
ncbi:hypothetical protein EX895_004480 [Sporisorium graminicola]|uniref:Peptidase A1 domain-containing protein n=1 Tax=Sporisorium graminicola TaxID=280036 RepID=A0A4V6ETJ2_9BASI|nr:hypothetical protein EX895_004480 [Sporisorium graminicola]TKY86839.1 hypothetical protein EX895_004480 [Sporisorium graminicola]